MLQSASEMCILEIGSGKVEEAFCRAPMDVCVYVWVERGWPFLYQEDFQMCALHNKQCTCHSIHTQHIMDSAWGYQL